jgi:hypothetical protein
MSDSPKRRRQFKPGPLALRRESHAATAHELRRLFNDNGILEKAETGELTIQVIKDAHPTPPMADEPICTRSQLLAYFDADGKKIAEAHRYLRKDGKIGASGKPDPKTVLHNGVLHFLDVP